MTAFFEQAPRLKTAGAASSRRSGKILGALQKLLRFADARQRVGVVSVWDGHARMRLPWLRRNFFCVGVYVTVRRSTDDDDDPGDQLSRASAASRAPAGATPTVADASSSPSPSGEALFSVNLISGVVSAFES